MTLIMLAGTIGCGKTTLAQRLNNEELVYQKTQTTYFSKNIFDTPGEYLEHGRFNHALLLTSYDADLVCLLESATAPSAKLPPGFATFFNRPVVGVVTKVDIATPEEIAAARQRLEMTGTHNVVQVSAVTGVGIDDLRERIQL